MNFGIDPVREYLIWRRYAYRFSLSFGGAMLFSLSSIAINTSTNLSYYAQILTLPDETAFGAGMVLCLIFYVGQIGLSEGFRHAPRILVLVAITNLLLSVAYLGNHSPTLLNLSALFTSLLYILIVNQTHN